MFRSRLVGAFAVSMTCFVASPASPQQHRGWCQGVGNPHQNNGCAATDAPVVLPGTNPPVVTETAATGTGTLRPTPVKIKVPVATPQGVPQQVPAQVPPVTQKTPELAPTVPTPQRVPQQVPAQVPPVTQKTPELAPTVPTPQRVPQQVPAQVPPVTQKTPELAPTVPTPQRVPQQVPALDPNLRPTGTSPNTMVLARPVPQRVEYPQAPLVGSTNVVTVQSLPQQAKTVSIVTAAPGRQAHGALPSYATADDGVVQCLASGFGWRYVKRPDGTPRLVGRLPVLRTTDMIVRDVPANQLMSPECVVAVDRRFARLGTATSAVPVPAGQTPGLAAQDRPLAGTAWRLVEIQSMDDAVGTTRIADPSRYTMQLNADGSVAFQLSCNSATGTWTAEAGAGRSSGRFEFGPLAATTALCPPPSVDEQVTKQAPYFRSYLLNEGRLYLSLMADGGIFVWEPMDGVMRR